MKEFVIVGKKISLAKIDINDAKQYAKWMNNSAITKGLGKEDMNIDEETEKEYLSNLIKNGIPSYTIIENETGKIIGNYGIFYVDENGVAEIGGFVGETSLHGKGYGTEAVELICDYAFQKLNATKVISTIYSFNEGSKKTFEKNGFVFVKLHENDFAYCNEKYKGHIYEINKDDFYQTHKTHFQNFENSKIL